MVSRSTSGVRKRTQSSALTAALLSAFVVGSGTASGLEDPPVAPAENFGPTPHFTPRLPVGVFGDVNTANGNVHTQIPLFQHLPGIGPAPNLSLVHSSRAVNRGSWPESPFGPGWSVDPLAVLEFLSPDSAQMTLGTGARVFFYLGQSSLAYSLTLTEGADNRWIVRSKYQDEWVFDFSFNPNRGRLEEIRDDVGNALVIDYDAQGVVSKLTDAGGRSVSFWDDDGDGLLDRLINDANPGNAVQFTYNSGKLAAISDPDGNTVSFGSTTAGRIQWLEDGYDDDQDGNPNRWNFTYGAGGKFASVTAPAPHSTVTSLAYAAYDGGSTTTLSTATGTTWTYDFDRFGRLKSYVNPLGGQASYVYTPGDKIKSMTDPEGHVWSYTYDSNGNRTELVDPDGQKVVVGFNSSNQPTSFASPRGVHCTFHYDDPALPTKVTRLVLPPDGLGSSSSTMHISWHPPGSSWPGRIKDVTDANGVTTTFSYNSWGGLEETVNGSGHDRPVRIQFSFNAQASTVTGRSHVAAPANDPAGFPGLPGPHPGRSGAPTRSAQISTNWLGDPLQVFSIINPALWPTGSGSPEAVATATEAFTYDYLGRTLSVSRVDEQPTIDLGKPALQRDLQTQFHDQPVAGFPHGGAVETTPDGMVRQTVLDEMGRVQSRSTSDGGDVEFTYHDDGMVHTVQYGSGAERMRVVDEYLANNMLSVRRVERTTNSGGTWSEERRLEYSYVNRLPVLVLDYNAGVLIAGTAYTYDARDQLIWEKRVGTSSYNRYYTYDAMGNRLLKLVLDPSDQLLEYVTYEYDVEDPAQFGSKANRLMVERTFDAGGVETNTAWYYYEDRFGSVREVVTKAAGDPWHYGTSILYRESLTMSLEYAPTLVLQRRWQADAQGTPIPGTVTWMRATELRQQGVMGRYLVEERDPQTLARTLDPDQQLWTDHADHDVLAAVSDFRVDPATGLANPESHLLMGLGEIQSGDPVWHVGDMVGNTRWWMTEDGGVFHDEVQTAFGERITTGLPFGSRFGGYSGLNGAEEGILPNGWVRMGARLYDPASGRWLQRDPLGLGGGLNEYEYVTNRPTVLADPDGLQAPAPRVTQEPTITILFTQCDGTQVSVVTPRGSLPVEAGGTLDLRDTSVLHTTGCGHRNSILPDPKPLPTNGPAPEPVEETRIYKFFKAFKSAHQPHPVGGPGNPANGEPYPIGPRPGPRIIKPRCFNAETVVWTPTGQRPISEIENGDQVWGMELGTGRLVPVEVEAVEVHRTPNLLCTVQVGESTVQVAPGHLLRVNDEWQPVGLAGEFNAVLTRAGVHAGRVVSRVSVTTEPIYNLRVKDSEVYLVGDAGVVVRDW